jgi:hypothetical protein
MKLETYQTPNDIVSFASILKTTIRNDTKHAKGQLFNFSILNYHESGA